MRFHAVAGWRWWCLLLLGFALGGCASTSTPLTDSLKLVFSPGQGAPAIPDTPDPRYTFLRVKANGYPPGMLALGFIDPHPEGPVFVWYSSAGDVLRTQNGRIVGSTGTPVEWSALRWLSAPPAWNAVPVGGYRYERERDVMPDYQFGIRETLYGEARPVPPDAELPATLPAELAHRYSWYREVVSGSTASHWLPPSLFAWGRYADEWTVVYSKQCLSPDLCIELQRWPVRKETVQ